MPAIHTEDACLARQVLAGDERAFRRLFHENYPRLYRFALARLPQHPNAAEDIAQLTLSKALRALAGYRGEAQLFTWLCAICRSEIASWARRHHREAGRVVLLEDNPEARAAVDSFAAHEDTALEHERAEHARLIQVVLDRLPPRYGDALEWKYVEGFSAQEIADRLNIGLEAANSLLARAKRAFKELYASMTAAVVAQTDKVP